MSRADELYRQTCIDILENGFSDEGLEVRPRWADGTPAHTIKKFGVVNRYNLAEEFPIMTLRRTYWKSAVDELLWIWQKKSNRICDLGSHVWDEWAGEDGTIGKAYGYQLGIKHHYKEGDMDQVDRVLYDLKHNPASRRILTNIYNFEDLHEMNLYPCAYSMTFNVTGNKLNAILNQRSQDMLTANNTIAILAVGPLAKSISYRYGIEPKRSASILDTMSCFAQSVIPWGAQLLIAAGLAAINPIDIIPYLYYPFLLGFITLVSIIFYKKKTI